MRYSMSALALSSTLCTLLVVVVNCRPLATVSSRVTPSMFDDSVCSNASQLPVVTMVSSCPCFLEYVITSSSPSTWDVYLIDSSSYIEWQRNKFSGVPKYREDFSTVNGASDASTTVQLQATNIFDSGLYALVIRASTNRTQCFGNLVQQQTATSVVFEAMPQPCAIRAEEPNVSSVPKIVGGSGVNALNSGMSFGWMALIWEVRNGRTRPICGGSQFRNGFIATAAHCLVHLAPHNYRVSVGKRSVDEQRAHLQRIEAAHAHPLYQTLASNEVLYDVAVIQLLDGGNDNTIALNIDARTPRTGAFVTAAGFGYISEEWPALPVPNRLLRVDVPVVSSTRCAQMFDGVRAALHVCAGYEAGGCDSCQADSGGPLRYVRDGQELLVGLTSFGSGCARARSAGVYTRVSAVAEWMEGVADAAAAARATRRSSREVALAAGGGVGAAVAAIVATAVVARWWRRARRRDAPSSARSGAQMSESGVSA